jgi:hypothetical protein
MMHPLFTICEEGFCVMYGWDSPSACVWILPGSDLED